MIYPRRTSNAEDAQLTGYSGPRRTPDNYSPFNRPQQLYAGAVPGRAPRDESGNIDADFSATGYDRMYRAPSKAETPGNLLTPITHAAPAQPSGQAPADPSHFSWSGSPYAGGGLSGSPTQFGNNFIGMQGYLNANKTPGLTNQSFDQYAAGPNAGYSKTMNALDSAMYGFYGVKDTRQKAADGTAAGAAAPAAAPAAPDTPATPGTQAAATAADTQDANFTGMRKGLAGGNRQRN